jgi:UDP-N-acetylmuramoyl-tripeptide--D-alanyl-D-alanine ligase
MRYKLRDFPDLLRTPIGRSQFLNGVYYRGWPLLSRAASFYRRTLGRQPRIIAVVGSFGKTTTAYAVSAALGIKVSPSIEINEWSYVAGKVLALRPWDQYGVIEVGIDGKGQMARFARMIRPDITVVTAIGSDHRRSLGSLEGTRTEKAEMVQALPDTGFMILNGDDPHVLWMRKCSRARVITFGLETGNDVHASDIRIEWPYGTRFRLHANGVTHDLRLRLFGRQMLYSILTAVSVAVAEKLPLDQVLAALEALPPTPGRMELIRLENGVYLLRDDYKASLETYHAALDILGEIPADRRWVVLGEVTDAAGSQGPIYRDLGERLGRVSSRGVFLCSRKHFQCYAAGAVRTGMPREALVNAHKSIAKAIEILKHEVQPGDVVLIKGRSTQRLDRITLGLVGKKMRCHINSCNSMPIRCWDCAMLERGWEGLRVVI